MPLPLPLPLAFSPEPIPPWIWSTLISLMAFAGIISSIRTSAANPNSGTGYELEVIAMVVIGGTALTGGRGSIVGTVLGVFILRVMRNGRHQAGT